MPYKKRRAEGEFPPRRMILGKRSMSIVSEPDLDIMLTASRFPF